jgi:hypothetical protein
MGADLSDGPVFPELQTLTTNIDNSREILSRIKTMGDQLIERRSYSVPTRFQNRIHLYISTIVEQLKDLDDFPINKYVQNQCCTALKLIEEGLHFLDRSYDIGDYMSEQIEIENESTPLLGEQNFYRNISKINAGMKFLQKFQSSITLPFICIWKSSEYTASSQLYPQSFQHDQ